MSKIHRYSVAEGKVKVYYATTIATKQTKPWIFVCAHKPCYGSDAAVPLLPPVVTGTVRGCLTNCSLVLPHPPCCCSQAERRAPHAKPSGRHHLHPPAERAERSAEGLRGALGTAPRQDTCPGLLGFQLRRMRQKNPKVCRTRGRAAPTPLLPMQRAVGTGLPREGAHGAPSSGTGMPPAVPWGHRSRVPNPHPLLATGLWAHSMDPRATGGQNEEWLGFTGAQGKPGEPEAAAQRSRFTAAYGAASRRLGSRQRGWLRDPGLGFTRSAPHGPALLKHSSPWHPAPCKLSS